MTYFVVIVKGGVADDAWSKPKPGWIIHGILWTYLAVVDADLQLWNI